MMKPAGKYIEKKCLPCMVGKQVWSIKASEVLEQNVYIDAIGQHVCIDKIGL